MTLIITGPVQNRLRDALKNHILEVYGPTLIRFAINGSGERELLEREIENIIGY